MDPLQAEKRSRNLTFEVEGSLRVLPKLGKRDEEALSQLPSAVQKSIQLKRKQFRQADKANGLSGEELSRLNERVVHKRSLESPWPAMSQSKEERKDIMTSAAQRTMKEGVEVRDNFHHYYKKNMTILGLEHQLDSSDTDSETSTNYETKIFCRRRHRPKVAAAHDPVTSALLKKEPSSWSYRANGIDFIGVATADIPQKTTGKRVEPIELNYKEPKRERLSRLEQYHKSRDEVKVSGGCLTTLPNDWDRRQEQEEKDLKVWKVEQTKKRNAKFAELETKKKTELAQMRKDAKGKRSVSSLTMREMDRRIAKLTKSHNESMVRHQMIMNTVSSSDPLE